MTIDWRRILLGVLFLVGLAPAMATAEGSEGGGGGAAARYGIYSELADQAVDSCASEIAALPADIAEQRNREDLAKLITYDAATLSSYLPAIDSQIRTFGSSGDAVAERTARLGKCIALALIKAKTTPAPRRAPATRASVPEVNTSPAPPTTVGAQQLWNACLPLYQAASRETGSDGEGDTAEARETSDAVAGYGSEALAAARTQIAGSPGPLSRWFTCLVEERAKQINGPLGGSQAELQDLAAIANGFPPDARDLWNSCLPQLKGVMGNGSDVGGAPGLVRLTAGFDRETVSERRETASDGRYNPSVAAWLNCLLDRRDHQLDGLSATLPASDPSFTAQPTLPSPPTLKIVSNSGTSCLTLEIRDLRMADTGKWAFTYRLANRCPRAQLYVAEEHVRNAEPAELRFVGASPLSVMNPGSWYLWSHQGLPGDLGFTPVDPQGDGTPPIKAFEVRTGSGLITANPRQTIFVWLASCDAYSQDNRVMTLFRAANHLADDPRVKCVANMIVPGEKEPAAGR